MAPLVPITFTKNENASWTLLPKTVSVAVALAFGDRNTVVGWMLMVGKGPGTGTKTAVELGLTGTIPIMVEFGLKRTMPKTAAVERVTFPEKPSRLVRVMFDEASPFDSRVMSFGLAKTEKSGANAGRIIVAPTVCVMAPLVAVTVTR